MFDQSVYNPGVGERVATHEGDLFHNYEIKSWEITPQVYKILAASVVVNLLALLVVGQTSLLTMKGCDSPFVGTQFWFYSKTAVFDHVYTLSPTMVLNSRYSYNRFIRGSVIGIKSAVSSSSGGMNSEPIVVAV